MMNKLFPQNDTGEKMTVWEFIDNSINSAIVERHTHVCSPDLVFLILFPVWICVCVAPEELKFSFVLIN